MITIDQADAARALFAQFLAQEAAREAGLDYCEGCGEWEELITQEHLYGEPARCESCIANGAK